MRDIRPHVSDQAQLALAADNIYTFEVPLALNKIEIKAQIERLYSVEVEAVRTCRLSGKPKRSFRLGANNRARIAGRRRRQKKAFVKLKPGQTISGFIPPADQTPATEVG